MQHLLIIGVKFKSKFSHSILVITFYVSPEIYLTFFFIYPQTFNKIENPFKIKKKGEAMAL